MTDEWLTERLAYLRGLKTPNDHQKLLLLLAEKSELNADDRRKLVALVRAEKAAQRAQKARANAARVVSAETRAAKAVDTKRKVLLGAFVLDQLTRNGIGPTLFTYEGKCFADWLTRDADRSAFGLATKAKIQS